MLERRIEEASLNSWPAQRQVLFDGWIMRFAEGYTKRANSVTPAYPSSLPIEEKIAFCERYYQQHQLPTVFRLPSFSAEAHILDDMLMQRDYRLADLTLVLSMLLHSEQTVLHAECRAASLEEWFSAYNQFSQMSEAQQVSHRAILQRIVPQPLFALYVKDNMSVACGVGVLEHEIFGLFDIITHPAYRRKGYATALVSGILAWASEQRARRAYLQVVGTNQQALRLYAKFGFQELYHYWYRIHLLT